jgi:serine protease Do
VIVKLNDRQITNSAELPAQVADMKPGTTVQLEVFRQGSTKHLNATLGELKETQLASADMGQQSGGRLGLTVRPLTAEERAEAGGSSGLLVENATGRAAQAGIQPGDLIVSLNGMPIKSAEQLRKLVAKAGKHIALLVQRDNARIFVPVDLG